MPTRLALPVISLAASVAAMAQPAPDPGPKPERRPETQPVTHPATRPVTQPSDTQPATQPDTQPATQPETQPSSRPTTRTSTRPTTTATSPSTATATATTTTATRPAEKTRYFAVVRGRVHTITGPVLDRATVLSKNGAIAAIGSNVQLPPDCEVLDARGMDVYPGLVAAGTGGIFAGQDPRDATDVYSLSMEIALAAGITTGLSENNVSKLAWGRPKDVLVKQGAFVTLSYPRNQPLERAQLRTDLERVRNYLREVARYEREKATNKEAKPPEKEWLREKFENYRKLLTHEAIAVFAAGDAQDLRDIADLARLYDFHFVVRGAYEGWTVAPALGRAHAMAVITPREDREPNPDYNRPTGSSIENARILREHGVTLAILPPTPGILLGGLAGRDLLHLNMEAAFAVRGGLSDEEALRAITIDAARVLGVDDRVGSLEVGKDMDLLVCDGNLLHYMTQVHYTVVNGRVAYDKKKTTLFAHIRPEGKPAASEFDDYWPRRLEWRD